jgi:hypothetical protein
MSVNYMDRLEAFRGEHHHAASASAPVLHADEEPGKKSRKKKRRLSPKQKAALAKGRRIAARRRKRVAEEGKRRTRRRKRVAKGTIPPERAMVLYRPSRRSKAKREEEEVMAKRGKSKRKSHKRKKRAVHRRRPVHRRRVHRRRPVHRRRVHRRRPAHRRRVHRRRPAHRRRVHRRRPVHRTPHGGGLVVFRRGPRHEIGRIYAMENPLSMRELGVAFLASGLGYLTADLSDRYLASSIPPLGGTIYSEASPIYSDPIRLGTGAALALLPLLGAHYVSSPGFRSGLQFFGLGSGLRTIGHLVSDLVVRFGKKKEFVQRFYPHEIVSQAQLAGAEKQGAGALPEHIGQAGVGEIPAGLASCCNISSRMLNAAVSPFQPIGRSAASSAPVMPPPAQVVQELPPAHVVQEPSFPPPAVIPPPVRTVAPAVTSQAPAPPVTSQVSAPPAPALPAPVLTQAQSTVAPTEVKSANTQAMTAAYAPANNTATTPVGAAGAPSPYAWADEGTKE